jgi:RNA polymerase sporulation-specific sigma factor
LAEVSKIRLLEPTEERNLWQDYKKQGDLESRRLLIEHYQPLVVKALARWRADEAIMMDLVQEGTVGLIEAAEKFDLERGVAFSLYAIHRIRGRMINYLEKEANALPVFVQNELIVDQSLPVAEAVERNFLLDQLHLALGRLPSKERLTLHGIFLEGQEARQLASSLQISSSHLYRLQKQGIRRVRGMLSRLMAEMKK